MPFEKGALPIGLWRTAAPHCPRNGFSPDPAGLLPILFPSARQALSALLKRSGLGRADRVAIPEWSSHCVISAVGEICTPLPMREAAQYAIPVQAVLLYETWGWPFAEGVQAAVQERFPEALLILDRVDSAQFNIHDPQSNIQNQLVSLSKLLGLKGGGLAFLRGEALRCEESVAGARMSRKLWADEDTDGLDPDDGVVASDRNFLLHLHKSHVAALHPDLRAWLAENDLWEALRQERERRRTHLLRLALDPACAGWPDWMRATCDLDAAPGIAPIFRGHEEPELRAAQRRLLERYRIETALYHFNWSGDPLNPRYEKCLAFPLHGMLQELPDFLSIL